MGTTVTFCTPSRETRRPLSLDPLCLSACKDKGLFFFRTQLSHTLVTRWRWQKLPIRRVSPERNVLQSTHDLWSGAATFYSQHLLSRRWLQWGCRLCLDSAGATFPHPRDTSVGPGREWCPIVYMAWVQWWWNVCGWEGWELEGKPTCTDPYFLPGCGLCPWQPSSINFCLKYIIAPSLRMKEITLGEIKSFVQCHLTRKCSSRIWTLAEQFHNWCFL